jgi:putative DNA primase/helicase
MIVGPTDEEFDAFVERERAKMGLTSKSSAVIIPLKQANDHTNKDQTNAGNEEHTQRPRPQILPPPTDPMAVAREFIKAKFTCGEDVTLRYWRGGWWIWHTSHWVELEDGTVKSGLYQFTEKAIYLSRANRAGFLEWSPTQGKINNLMDALRAVCLLRSDIDQPSWLDDRKDKRVIVATANGLLDVERRELLNHTPKFFNQTAVPFAYDPDAAEPKQWRDFLNQVWPNEPEAINVLAEWFGYIVSGRTNLHKIFLMVGPTRGGKGVIARILGAMIGDKNIAAPTLNSFSGEFGLQPLIGKPLAVISDARFAGKDSSIVVERLLSISGEDSLTINRKYRDQWTGKLCTRLHLISNELPKLSDASAAIVGRMIVVLTTESWINKEDVHLEDKLRTELTGILNWALDGLRRLSTNNKFTRLATADEAIADMRDLASPVGAFVREKCVVGPNYQIGTDALYAVYKGWADETGHIKKNKEHFGRDLKAIARVRKQRPRKSADRLHVYVGIDVRNQDDDE